MKPRLLAALAAAGLMIIIAATLPLGRNGSVAQGSPAPAFQLAGLSGGLSSLSDFSGRVVLLDFWATWCEDCRKEMPMLQSLHRRLEGRGFTVVAVSLDEDGRKVVAPFVSRHGLTYPVLLADDKVKAAYRIYGLPTAYLLDREGTVIARYIGVIESAALENDILKLLERRKT